MRFACFQHPKVVCGPFVFAEQLLAICILENWLMPEYQENLGEDTAFQKDGALSIFATMKQISWTAL
jgi:hypothetical protein